MLFQIISNYNILFLTLSHVGLSTSWYLNLNVIAQELYDYTPAE